MKLGMVDMLSESDNVSDALTYTHFPLFISEFWSSRY